MNKLRKLWDAATNGPCRRDRRAFLQKTLTAAAAAAFPALARSGWSTDPAIGLPRWQTLAVIVAHPDDESLWFNPVLPAASEVIQAALPPSPDQEQAYRDIFRHYPVYRTGPTEALHAYPPYTDGETFNREILYMDPDLDPAERMRLVCEKRDIADYGLARMTEALRPHMERLADEGIQTVLTHNPWGEYGHPHHRMVFLAVRALSLEIFQKTGAVLNIYTDLVARPHAGEPDPEGEHYHAVELPNVPTLGPFKTQEERFRQARRFFAERTFYPADKSLWTWHPDTTDVETIMASRDYPHGLRSFAGLVTYSREERRMIDWLREDEQLRDLVMKIRGDIPLAPEEEGIVPVVPPSYDCNAILGREVTPPLNGDIPQQPGMAP